jgi:hypothetical protein
MSTYRTSFIDARLANGDYWGRAATIQPHRFAPLVPIDLIEKGSEGCTDTC